MKEIPLKLSKELEREHIVFKFVIEKRTSAHIILKLNEVHNNKKFIFSIYHDWDKLIARIKKQLAAKSIDKDHIQLRYSILWIITMKRFSILILDRMMNRLNKNQKMYL